MYDFQAYIEDVRKLAVARVGEPWRTRLLATVILFVPHTQMQSTEDLGETDSYTNHVWLNATAISRPLTAAGTLLHELGHVVTAPKDELDALFMQMRRDEVITNHMHGKPWRDAVAKLGLLDASEKGATSHLQEQRSWDTAMWDALHRLPDPWHPYYGKDYDHDTWEGWMKNETPHILPYQDQSAGPQVS